MVIDWSLTGKVPTLLNSLKKHMANDLKLSNIMVGIQSHGSTYPSHMCECRRPDKKSGNSYTVGDLRTLGMCRKNAADYADYMKSNPNAKKAHSRRYKNCVNQPLFDDPDDTLVMSLIPPSELHLLIGPVNHIYKEIFVN